MGSVECVTCHEPVIHSAFGGSSDAAVFFAPASVCDDGGRSDTAVEVMIANAQLTNGDVIMCVNQACR